jgi:hypothetical protein
VVALSQTPPDVGRVFDLKEAEFCAYAEQRRRDRRAAARALELSRLACRDRYPMRLRFQVVSINPTTG